MPSVISIMTSTLFGWAAIQAFAEGHPVFGTMLLFISMTAMVYGDK